MIDPKRFQGSDEAVRGLLDRQQAVRAESQRASRQKVSGRPIPKHGDGERFVRGPIPYAWLCAALALGNKAGNLAWAIWWLVGVERSNPVRLTARVLRDFQMSPRTARRILGDFERVGLVEVERRRGRGPTVTVLALPPPNIAED